MDLKKLLSVKYLSLMMLLICIETLAQYYLKKQVNIADSYIGLIIGCLGYVGVGIVYYLFLTSKMNLTLANNIWNLGTALTVTLVGIFMFGETMTVINWLGLVLALGGVYLLSLR